MLKLVSLVESFPSELSTNAPLQFNVAPPAETHRWASYWEATRRDVVGSDWPGNPITSCSVLFRLGIILQSLCDISKSGVDWIPEERERERVEQLLTSDGM